MAMSDTMSSSPNDWVQFYRRAVAGQLPPPPPPSSMTTMFDGRVSDATVVTTTVTSASSPSPPGLGNSSIGHLSPDGRVSKPARRRARASRRTPTTLLNTDTTNFRAMVQQFTGGPSASLPSGSHTGALNFDFGLRSGHRDQQHLNTASFIVPFNYHQQQQQQQRQQQQQQQQYYQQQQQQQYMNNNNNTGEVFLPSFNNPRPINLEMSDGFVLPMPSSSNDNRNNGYIL